MMKLFEVIYCEWTLARTVLTKIEIVGAVTSYLIVLALPV